MLPLAINHLQGRSYVEARKGNCLLVIIIIIIIIIIINRFV